jgi:hypothetical protein
MCHCHQFFKTADTGLLLAVVAQAKLFQRRFSTVILNFSSLNHWCGCLRHSLDFVIGMRGCPAVTSFTCQLNLGRLLVYLLASILKVGNLWRTEDVRICQNVHKTCAYRSSD